MVGSVFFLHPVFLVGEAKFILLEPCCTTDITLFEQSKVRVPNDDRRHPRNISAARNLRGACLILPLSTRPLSAELRDGQTE